MLKSKGMVHDLPEAVAAGGSAGIQLGLNSATLTFILATGVQMVPYTRPTHSLDHKFWKGWPSVVTCHVRMDCIVSTLPDDKFCLVLFCDVDCSPLLELSCSPELLEMDYER